MNAYSNALDGTGTTMVLSPDSEFFRFFRSPDGDAPAAGAAGAAPPAAAEGGSGAATGANP
jgi:membrane protease subunit HflC